MKATEKREKIAENITYQEYNTSDIMGYLGSLAGDETIVFIDSEDWHHCYLYTEDNRVIIFERASDWSDSVIHAVIDSESFNKSFGKASSFMERVKLFGMIAQNVTAECYCYPYLNEEV